MVSQHILRLTIVLLRLCRWTLEPSLEFCSETKNTFTQYINTFLYAGFILVSAAQRNEPFSSKILHVCFKENKNIKKKFASENIVKTLLIWEHRKTFQGGFELARQLHV